MKYVKFSIVLVLLISLVLISCKEKVDNENFNKKDININKVEKSEEEKQKEFHSSLLIFDGGSFMINRELHGDKAILTYSTNAYELKSKNPKSKITQSEIDEYFKTGDKVSKILVNEPIRCFKKLDFVKQVQLILPFEGKVNVIEVSREDAAMWSSTFSSIDDEKRRQQFLEKYLVKK